MLVIRALPLCLVPLVAFACVAPKVSLEPEQKQGQEQVRIVSAQSFVIDFKAEVGSPARNRCKGRATDEILPLLEDLVLRGARETFTYGVYFPGRGGRGGFGGKTNWWIRCSFDNGQDVDIEMFPPGPFGLVQGERKFRLMMSEETNQALRAPSAWDSTFAKEEAGVEMTANEWIGRNLTFEDITLDESPMLGDQGKLLLPISAGLYSTRDCRCPEDSTTHRCAFVLVGEAKADTVFKLKEALHGSREIFLRFYPDGDRVLPSWLQDKPSNRVLCKLGNGRVVTIDYFTAPDAWCVEGEEGLQLTMWRLKSSDLLGAWAWKSVEPPAAK